MEKDVLVSVILIAENSEDKHVENAIKNVIDQTYKNVDLLVTSFDDLKDVKKKCIGLALNIRWFKSEPGPTFLSEILKEVHGDVVFYKTVNNVLWFPRHIEVHMNNFGNDKNCRWSLSHVEYRNYDIPDHPLNTIGFRISNPPPLEEISLDEVAHYTDATPDWNACVKNHPEGGDIFFAGFACHEWQEKGLRGTMPAELTVVEWKRQQQQQEVNIEEVAKQIGVPARTDIKDDMKEDNGEIKIVRDFPTIMGNVAFEEYNNAIKESMSQVEDITSIAVKRCIGMGDVLVVEPIIKKLKQKYPNAEVNFYTAKTGIVDYFVHKPDNTIQIEENTLLQDVLHDKPEQIKFDLDLSYESRIGWTFIDAYAEVCGIEFDDYEDKYPALIETIEDRALPPFGEKPSEKLAIVCGDGSGWPGKTWDLNKYAEVIKHLQANDWRVLETGVYHTDLTQSDYHECDFHTMINVIKNADLYIGTDNGPMHIARAYNIPSVLIAGAALPYYTNPNREHVFYVQDNSSPHLGEKHKFFFGLNGDQITFVPGNEEDPSCGLNNIKPEHVIGAIDKMMLQTNRVENRITGNNMNFYFNIPKHSYYIDKEHDFIMKGDDEHPDQDKDISEEYAPRWEEILENHAKPWVEMIKKFKSEGMFLDVGCNIGCTVKAAMDAGYDAHGCDINKPSIEKAKEIFPEYFEAPVRLHYNSSVNSQFDIITSDQVIEHIEDPVEWLEELKMALNDDGIIFIGCPNFRSKEAQKKWGKWGQVGTGEHLWLPTPKSMEYILEKAGLDYEHLEDPYESGGFVLRCWKK